MMLATRSPLFATEIYPHSSQITTAKNNFDIDDFYYTLQSILDEDHHHHHHHRQYYQRKQQQEQEQQHNDAIAYPTDKSPVWHNRGVKRTTTTNDDTCINSYNDYENKQVSWNKGSANIGIENLLWSTPSNNITTVTNHNGRRRSSVQSLSTIKEEEE